MPQTALALFAAARAATVATLARRPATAALLAASTARRNFSMRCSRQMSDAMAQPPAPAATQAAPAQPAAATEPVAAAAQTPNYITIDDFAKMNLVVGQVLSAEVVPKSKKLLKLSVNIGEASPRTILSGVRPWFGEPDAQGQLPALVGKKVVVVENLQPRQMMGHLSHGMLLMALDEKTNTMRPVGPLGSDADTEAIAVGTKVT